MGVKAALHARLYDRLLAGAERASLGAWRAELLGDLTGRVLEVGAGTGANLAHYPAALEELVLTEPAEPMARRLRERLARTGRRATVVIAPAESLPFADARFDVAVATLALCTVEDPARALAEVRRVLVPGGRLVFLEHVRAEDPRLARWQDRLERPWGFVGEGCHPNRDTGAAIARAGFAIERLDRGEVRPAPPFSRPLIAGVARAPGA